MFVSSFTHLAASALRCAHFASPAKPWQWCHVSQNGIVTPWHLPQQKCTGAHASHKLWNEDYTLCSLCAGDRQRQIAARHHTGHVWKQWFLVIRLRILWMHLQQRALRLQSPRGARLTYNYTIITDNKTHRFGHRHILGLMSNQRGLYRERRSKYNSIYSPKICRAFNKAPAMTAAKGEKLWGAKRRHGARITGRWADVQARAENNKCGRLLGAFWLKTRSVACCSASAPLLSTGLPEHLGTDGTVRYPQWIKRSSSRKHTHAISYDMKRVFTRWYSLYSGVSVLLSRWRYSLCQCPVLSSLSDPARCSAW